MTYDQARKRAGDIAAQVVDRKMPPWKPDPKVGPGFKHSKALSEDEIAILSAWAEAGAPEGDRSDLPTPPVYRDGWALGDPDLILEASEDFAIPASGADIYRCFVIPTNLPDDKYISAIEYRAATRRSSTTSSLTSTLPGRHESATRPTQASATPAPSGLGSRSMVTWAAGHPATSRPSSRRRGPDLAQQSRRRDAGALSPERQAETDRPGSASTSPGSRSSNCCTGTPWATSASTFLPVVERRGRGGLEDSRVRLEGPVDVTALAVTPHMHLLGQDITMSVTFPDGKDLDLIRIGDWDFNWQNTYYFEKPIELPKGSLVKVRAHYNNPSAKVVKWGEGTNDEMCIGFIAVVQKGQDLTRAGEKDTLREVFREQGEERRRFGEEFARKMKEAAEKKKAEAAQQK